jgi:caffeoyl-CoA O-methyltransferase
MSPKSFVLTPEVHDYLLVSGTAPDALQAELIDRTQTELGGLAGMQIAPEQGAFMELFVRAIGARDAVEVGTFTGYSALAIARALPADGHLLCCDISEEFTAIAREFWARAGVADRVELRIGPALDTLRALPETEQFDVAFIDADKGNYAGYFEALLPRMRANGVIIVDNVLWAGRVLDDEDQSDDTQAIRAFNKKVAADDRVDTVMMPIGDGLTFLRKR